MLLDDNFEMQGGVRNYLGETQEVTAPKFWKSSKDSPSTELVYITEAEKGLLLDANLHGSLKNGKPNIGASGLLSYDGWGDATAGGGMDTSGGNAGAEGGQGDGSGGYSSSNNNNNYSVQDDMTDYATNVGKEAAVGGGFVGDNNNDGGNNYVVPNPQLPPGVISNNFDYETDAYSMDAGYGLGTITNATWDNDTKSVNIEQTPGIINTEQYQTANLGAYLDSPDVSDKDKKDTLNKLQALSNSNLKGSKLSNIETDFVLDNLDLAFNNIKDQTKYSEYTSSIDENATTFAGDLSDNLLGTVAKSGGVIGTMFRGITDTFKNNNALEVLGYTGKTIQYNPDGSGDFNYGGGFLTGNASEGERDAVNQLTPLAANVVGGTTPQRSMVNDYFANLNNTNLGISENYLNTYNTAKTKMANILNMTAPDQQYGYENNYRDTYARQMNNSNVFYNYLNEQGLI